MGLKRKRSSEYTYSPTSSTSSFFSPSTCGSSSPSPNPWQLQPIRPHFAVQMELDFPTSKPFRLLDNDSGRTRKRWRDNRPDEETIHESTFQKLFNAQKEHPHAEPVLSRDPPIATTQAVFQQKSTLHSFWNIRQPQPVFTVPTLPEEAVGARCEDCDRHLEPGDGSMDLDSGNGGEWACHTCGRSVCDLCAVNSDARKCLECVQDGR